MRPSWGWLGGRMIATRAAPGARASTSSGPLHIFESVAISRVHGRDRRVAACCEQGGRVAENTVTNWFGNVVSHPAVIVDANSVDDIVRVLKDKATYPSPVRTVGS